MKRNNKKIKTYILVKTDKFWIKQDATRNIKNIYKTIKKTRQHENEHSNWRCARQNSITCIKYPCSYTTLPGRSLNDISSSVL